MAITAILFDIDGTLVDSNDHHVAAWAAAFDGIGRSVDRQTIHDQIGKGTDMLVPTLMPDLDEAAQERLGEAHSAAFKAHALDVVQPFPGARDLLDARDLVAETTSSDDVENTKPAPDIFATALRKIGSPPPAAVMVVGDTPYDIEAAAKCGIAAIGLRSGKFTDAVLTQAGAVAIYDDAAALLRDYDRSPLAG